MRGEPDDPYLIHYTFDTRNGAVKGNVREINFQNYVAKHLKGKDDRTDSRFYTCHAGTDFTCLQEVRTSQLDSFYCPQLSGYVGPKSSTARFGENAWVSCPRSDSAVLCGEINGV